MKCTSLQIAQVQKNNQEILMYSEQLKKIIQAQFRTTNINKYVYSDCMTLINCLMLQSHSIQEEVKEIYYNSAKPIDLYV